MFESNPKLRQAAQQMNAMAATREPFIFLVDFELQSPRVLKLTDAASEGVWYNFEGNTNWIDRTPRNSLPTLRPRIAEDFLENYQRAFKNVQSHLLRGDAYLVNLTGKLAIQGDISLADIFVAASAPYKLYVENEYVVFSPESFVSIEGDEIKTFPMKGTSPWDSIAPMLDDPKEIAEHATVVDLLRNDLSMVAYDFGDRLDFARIHPLYRWFQ